MIDVIHRDCGQVAVRLKRELVLGFRWHIADFEHVDGSPVKYGDRMRCDSCQENFSGFRPGPDGIAEAVS